MNAIGNSAPAQPSGYWYGLIGRLPATGHSPQRAIEVGDEVVERLDADR